MAVTEDRVRLKVHLDEGHRVADIFVSPATKCCDIVQRLQRQIHANNCFLLEVWQGCERLVPDNESMLSTLLEWGSDLQDVRFYLRHREETVSFRQVVNGPSLRVNGFKEEPLPSKDVLLGGSQMSVDDLKEIAARQQQEIAMKERELKTKQVQLMEIKRKTQRKSQSPHVQQLSAKVDEQSERLTALRHAQDQVDSYKLSNSALGDELESVRSLFLEKEKELAIAVAKVESLTQQLDKQRQGLCGPSSSQTKTHQQLELERLRKELMTRNELNHQQSIQIQSQKQLLAEKHKELFELDAQIDQHSEELRKKTLQNNHTDHDNNPLYSSGEEEFLEMDYSNLGNFGTRPSKGNSGNSKSGSVSVGASHGHPRNSRKLETLLEVEEEVSDGHASSKSSTEDLSQGPGPPEVSRVTAAKSRFESTKSQGPMRNAPDQLYSEITANTAAIVEADQLSNGFSVSLQRVEPEGVEATEFSSSELSNFERRANDDKEAEVFANSLLKLKRLRDQAAEMERKMTPKLTPKLKESLLEQDNLREVKRSMGDSESKNEAPSWNSGHSTPSDTCEHSSFGSPSSSSSSPSSPSRSTSPKAAIFAVTALAKNTGESRKPVEFLKLDNRKDNPSILGKQEPEDLPREDKIIQPSKANIAESIRGFRNVKNTKSFQEEILSARRVKSEALSTKNERVSNNSDVRKNACWSTEENPRPNGAVSEQSDVLPKQHDALPKQNDAFLNQNDKLPKHNDAFNNAEGRATDFSEAKTTVKSVLTGKTNSSPTVVSGKKVIRLQTLNSELPLTPLQTDKRTNPALEQALKKDASAVEDNESKTAFSLKSIQPTVKRDAFKEKEMDPLLTAASNQKTGSSELLKATSPGLSSTHSALQSVQAEEHLIMKSPKNEGASDFAVNEKVPKSSLNSVLKSNQEEFDRRPADQSFHPNVSLPVGMTAMAFKPISLKAKKLANQQRNDGPLFNRSPLAPVISNSISVRGQPSLSKITITPSATFFSAPASDRPEKRSPVPTSKRSRFGQRVAAPSYSEEEESENFQDSAEECPEAKSFDGVTVANEDMSKFEDVSSQDVERTNTNGEKGDRKQRQGKTPEEPRKDPKHVVSSVNIKLANHGIQQMKDKKENIQMNSSFGKIIKPLKQESKSANGNVSNFLYTPSENGRSQFGSSRLSILSTQPSSDSNRNNAKSANRTFGNKEITSEIVDELKVENSERSADKQSKSETLSRNDCTSRLSPPTQVASPLHDRTQEGVFTRGEFPLTNENNNPEILRAESCCEMNTVPFTIGDDRSITKPTESNESSLQTLERVENSIVPTVEESPLSDAENGSNDRNISGEMALLDQAPVPKTKRKKKAQRVSLDPHAVLLDASVEGELDIVKQIVSELEDPSKPNPEGITALHNAVCASHDEVVKFLVRYGCDINSRDSHGWTPLHCAAANNATEMSRFLVEHGACVLAATSLESKTPGQCCERGEPGYSNCTRYLSGVEQNLGIDNEGRVFTLYSYSANEKDELSFECGEELKVIRREDAAEKEWWWAENKDSHTGYIPRNLLGLYPRISPKVQCP